jgi:acylphosphatase
MARVARRVRITGRVQGVGFRAWTAGEARRRGLDGWVRNETDGAVTAVLAGEEAAVAAMLAALHRGPPAAAVTAVEAGPAADPGGGGFAIRR